ncbi:hypothetical protein [Salinicoccus sp. CNSTN-B1]
MDRRWYPLPIFMMGIILSFFLSMMYGTNAYSLGTVAQVIFNLDMTDQVHQILYEIRMPRVLAASGCWFYDKHLRSDTAVCDA